MKKINIDEGAIRKLAEILHDTDLSEIEYSENEHSIRISRALATSPQFSYINPTITTPQSTLESTTGSHPGLVKSPMVGTVYLSAEPGAPHFVKVGDTVSVGQNLLIIEAMKVMNPIKSPFAGRITKILVQDTEPVEFGASLLIIE